ncbi:MAG TPA: hypothetical protein VN764_20080, partial [Polyangiaceae bacterium]|nr:hypothetical protein [Polyangiaceae bacterium]
MDSSVIARRLWLQVGVGLLLLCSVGCANEGEKSARLVVPNLKYVASAVERDLGEVRRGMPAGAKELTTLFERAAPERPAAADAREELVRLRSDNPDISSAKSTFFLIAASDGTILRNNLDSDEMAEKNLFQVYPATKNALTQDYVELGGSWDVARGVNNRPDAQWLSSARIMVKGTPVGLFVSGWSWSSYAYRLEMALRSEVLGETKSGDKVPLLYVYVVVDGHAYGTPVSPVVNGEEILKLNPVAKAKGKDMWT